MADEPDYGFLLSILPINTFSRSSKSKYRAAGSIAARGMLLLVLDQQAHQLSRTLRTRCLQAIGRLRARPHWRNRLLHNLSFYSGGVVSGPAYLTCEEVIERYRSKVSDGTLRNWRCKRIGPSYIKIGKAILYPTDELDRWDRSNLTACGRRPFASAAKIELRPKPIEMGAGFGNETTEIGRRIGGQPLFVQWQWVKKVMCQRVGPGPGGTDRGPPEFRLVEASHIPQLTAPLPPVIAITS